MREKTPCSESFDFSRYNSKRNFNTPCDSSRICANRTWLIAKNAAAFCDADLEKGEKERQKVFKLSVFHVV